MAGLMSLRVAGPERVDEETAAGSGSYGLESAAATGYSTIQVELPCRSSFQSPVPFFAWESVI